MSWAGSSDVPADDELVQVARYSASRIKLGGYAFGVSMFQGILYFYLGITFTPGVELGFSLVAAILLVIAAHEAVHGGVATLLGHHPIFGIKPPLVYVTFATKIPRNHLIVIALAPLILLDLVFAALYVAQILELPASLCFGINTIGAVGDLWIVANLVTHGRGTFVQDTKTGVEIWEVKTRG